MKTIITNAHIINEEERFFGSILIEDEFIKTIYKGEIVPNEVLQSANVVDAKGRYLIPGVIDDQVHFLQGASQPAPSMSDFYIVGSPPSGSHQHPNFQGLVSLPEVSMRPQK